MKKTIGYDLESVCDAFPIGGIAIAAAVVCYFSL